MSQFFFSFRANTRNFKAHGLCYHYLMRILGKKIGKKQIKTTVLVFATLALLLSGILPFLSILIK